MMQPLPILALVGGVWLLAMGGMRVAKRQPRGILAICTGIVGILWAVMRIVLKNFPQFIDAQTRPGFEHYATLLAGAGITLAILLVAGTCQTQSKPLRKPEP